MDHLAFGADPAREHEDNRKAISFEASKPTRRSTT
jgi:hypothetical protein